MKKRPNPVAQALNTIHRPKTVQMKTRYSRKGKKGWKYE